MQVYRHTKQNYLWQCHIMSQEYTLLLGNPITIQTGILSNRDQ